jgi:hypothetical protein
VFATAHEKIKAANDAVFQLQPRRKLSALQAAHLGSISLEGFDRRSKQNTSSGHYELSSPKDKRLAGCNCVEIRRSII